MSADVWPGPDYRQRNVGLSSKCSDLGSQIVSSKTRRRVVVPVGDISGSILIVRGQRVILDRELAASYGVTTKRLHEQVKRNSDRFP